MSIYSPLIPIEQQEYWQTSIAVFNVLGTEFCFSLDVAASHQDAFCVNYLTELDDVLRIDWQSDSAIWCSLSYSRITNWVEKKGYYFFIV